MASKRPSGRKSRNSRLAPARLNGTYVDYAAAGARGAGRERWQSKFSSRESAPSERAEALATLNRLAGQNSRTVFGGNFYRFDLPKPLRLPLVLYIHELVALDYPSGQTGKEMADGKCIANLMKIRALAASLVGPPCAGAARLPAITPDYP